MKERKGGPQGMVRLEGQLGTERPEQGLDPRTRTHGQGCSVSISRPGRLPATPVTGRRGSLVHGAQASHTPSLGLTLRPLPHLLVISSLGLLLLPFLG